MFQLSSGLPSTTKMSSQSVDESKIPAGAFGELGERCGAVVHGYDDGHSGGQRRKKAHVRVAQSVQILCVKIRSAQVVDGAEYTSERMMPCETGEWTRAQGRPTPVGILGQ